MSYPATDALVRLFRYIDIDGPLPDNRPELGPCWVWTGKSRAGRKRQYGHFGVSRDCQVYPHRWLYILLRGMPEHDLDHLCRRELCCNPWHLEDVTKADNIGRGLLGILKTHCVQGHALTDANTYRPKRGENQRQCKTCKRKVLRQWRKRNPGRNARVTSATIKR